MEISRQLARKFAYADEFPEQAQRRRRKSKLDPYVDYLEARVETGCYSGTTLFREIERLGFTGARTLVSRWLRQKRYGPEGKAPKKSTQHRPWAVARMTWLFVLAPDKLKTEELEVLERIKAVDERGQQLYELCQSFADMIRAQTSSALTSWLEKATHSNIKPLVNFAQSIQQDLAAVAASLTFRWSNGPVEGHVNRLKLIKRQMYGRAGFDLLRKRVLEST